VDRYIHSFDSEKIINDSQKGISKMKKFSAEMKVVRFGAEDMIVTSGVKTLTWSGLEDKTGNNNYITFNGNSYLVQNSASKEFKTMKSDLAAYFEDSALATKSNSDIKFGSYSLNSFIGSTSERTGADGTYVYDGNFIFTKKQ